MNNVIEVKALKKSFKKHVVLENLNLNVKENKITTIYGKSGTGKSTLLNIIGLLEKYNDGSITLLGQNAPKVGSKKANDFIRNNIGYLFQSYALINDQSVKKNLDLANLDPKLSRSQFESKKIKLLKQLNIQVDEKQKVGTLSGGQQQRIALARAILKPCKLLLCDEPTGSLDPENKKSLFEALEYVKTQGKTILIVSHDPYIINHSDEVHNINNLMTKD